MIYVRNKAEALDAVASVLALPERRQQIVQLTVRIAMCLDSEARSFLADCQAGLIEGGLESMRKRRHELLAAHQEEAPEAIVIIDNTEDQLLEQVGVALDALRLSEIVRQVFPVIREKHAAWEVARTFLAAEDEVRKVMVEAVRAHGAGDSKVYEHCRAEMERRISAVTPAWMAILPTIEAACAEVASKDAHLLGAIAVDDMRARLVVDLLANNHTEAIDYLKTVKARIDTLHQLENEANA
ncbi:MAG TPA: hypothetical protein VG457_05915 [Planctomycetota bacterium]|nr:hypothetical protein [Planctomycetota bacterium]